MITPNRPRAFGGRPRPALRPAAAAVELAVLSPFLIFICIIGADWARLFYFTVSAESCARNGALYASDPIARGQSPYSSVSEAALAEAPALQPIASVTQALDPTGSSVIVTVSVPFRTITNFPGAPGPQTLVRRVQMPVLPTSTR